MKESIVKEKMKQCKDILEAGKVWECFSRDIRPVKAFVSTACGGIDFDSNFELHQIKTAFGQMISVRKK